MRALVPFLAILVTACSAAAAQSPAGCHRDSDCTLVDVCGCECHAIVGAAPPPAACSEACQGHPCEGHRAVCAGGSCVMR